MVSNINELHFKYLEENFKEYFKYFSYIFLSYEMGLRKPDPKIYKLIMEYLKLPAQNITYTDDRPELIEAAKRLNIDAFVFKGVDSLIEELLKRDIKLDLVLSRRK